MVVLASTNGIAQFLTALCIFVFVLLLAIFTTRWVGSYQKGQMTNKNIKVVETFRISSTKYIQILQIGSKYIAVAVSKDNVTKIADLSKEDIVSFEENPDRTDVSPPGTTFSRVLENMKEQISQRMKK